MRRILLIFFFFLLFFVYPKYVLASENFLTSYDVTYNVFENENTKTSFEVTLTNTEDRYYVASYSISTGFETIQNIKASDPDGEIIPKITKIEKGNKIELIFNKRVSGKGNSLVFKVNFDTPDVAKKQGNIWEIDIPGIANQNEFEQFNVHLRVPQSFGNPTFIKPYLERKTLDFDKEDLGNSGISLAFGEKQIYNFDLSYHLKNSRVFPIKTEIALPPNTNYQEISIESIVPKPLNVKADKDGNWLAEYFLLPSQKVDVKVKGKAIVSLFPKKEILSPVDLNQYLKTNITYWESNEKIKELGKTLKTPKAIYDYVVRTLSYDFSRVTENKPRLGGKGALLNPKSAVCLEFTDLFIAIARSAGIPTREINGFAYTENEKLRPLSLVKDILHSWPEYYDIKKQTWIMVDPTWGNTTGGIDYFDTFDFDHLAFVIKGRDSRYPIPAGGYKLSDSKDQRDVKISFAEEFPVVLESYEVSTDLPEKILSGLPINTNVIIKNKSQSVLSGKNLVIESSLNPQNQKIALSNIPPYGSLNVPVIFEKTPFLTNKNGLVTILVGEKALQKRVSISPFILTREVALLGGVFLAVIFFLIFIITQRSGHLPFFRRKGEDSLRRQSQES